MAKKEKTKNLDEMLDDYLAAYSRWVSHSKGEACNYGCGDGAMMNMERRNMISIVKSIEERFPGTTLPIPIPNEVDRDRWFNMEDWSKRGHKLLDKYKNNEDYKYLCRMVDKLNSKQKATTHIETVIGYVSRFEKALYKWPYESGREWENRWYVRRHVSCPYFDSFVDCVKRVKALNIHDDGMFVENNGQLCFAL